MVMHVSQDHGSFLARVSHIRTPKLIQMKQGVSYFPSIHFNFLDNVFFAFNCLLRAQSCTISNVREVCGLSLQMSKYSISGVSQTFSAVAKACLLIFDLYLSSTFWLHINPIRIEEAVV